MKRSRIFLGLTTGLLAVVGIAAVKAHRIAATIAYYSLSGIASPVLTQVDRTATATFPSQAKTADGKLIWTNTNLTVPAYYHAN